MGDAAAVQRAVLRHYAELAGAPSDPSECGLCDGNSGACWCRAGGNNGFGIFSYDDVELSALPQAAIDAAVGCGDPIPVAHLHAGERVLDLGCGGGIDVILAAAQVGPTGRVCGVDLTDEMVDLARRNVAEVGLENVEIVTGAIEDLPVPSESFDVVIANGVINLSIDKPRALTEAARVLRPGGRFAMTDVVADPDLDEGARSDMEWWTGCIAGPLTAEEYRKLLAAAGMVGVSLVESHRVHRLAGSAIIRARKPELPGPHALTRGPSRARWRR